MNRLIIACLSGLFLLINQSFAIQEENIANRDFWHPQYHGKALAYCTLDNKCGKVVADKYCQILGYDKADKEIINYNTGLTNYIDSRATCKGWECNSFKKIKCSKVIKHEPAAPYYYRKKRFAYPRYHQYRIDWCYKKGMNCGKTSAKAFCRIQGYMDTSHYQVEHSVYASQNLGSGELCFGKTCKGFKYIDCQR
jgi:hypothetical protein